MKVKWQKVIIKGNKRNICPKTYKTCNTWLRQLCDNYLILNEENNDICAKIFVLKIDGKEIRLTRRYTFKILKKHLGDFDVTTVSPG